MMEHIGTLLVVDNDAIGTIIVPFPRIPGVVLEVYSVHVSDASPTGGAVGSAHVGLTHDLSLLSGSFVPNLGPNQPNVWWGIINRQEATDIAKAYMPPTYFQVPYLIAGPQLFFAENKFVNGFTMEYFLSIYFTRSRIPRLAWADLLDRTSFDRSR